MISLWPPATRKRTDRASMVNEAEPRSRNRVVWMVNQYAVATNMSGITRHIELGALMRRLDWKTTIFAAAFHHNTASLIRDVSIWHPTQQDEQEGVRFSWLYSTPYRQNGWKRYVNMVSFTATMLANGLVRQRERPDVVIGSSPHLLAGLGAWLIARRYRVPFIFEVRDVWPDMLVQLGLTSPVIIKPLVFVERLLYRRADKIIALTDGIADRIAAKGVSRDKIAVVPNSILRPKSLDDDRRAARRRELGWTDKVIVIWAGSQKPMNGLDVVIDAARELRDREDVLFVLIGDGSLKDQLMEQADGLSNVEFRDPVPKTDVGDWLRAADIGLVHSRRFEVFEGARPNKLFEYMAAGIPIACTVPGEAWRLIDEAGAGVFAEWENPAALAAAISSLANAPERRHWMGRYGFEYVSRRHSREATASQLAELLDRVCALHESEYSSEKKAAAETISTSPDWRAMPYRARTTGGPHAAD